MQTEPLTTVHQVRALDVAVGDLRIKVDPNGVTLIALDGVLMKGLTKCVLSIEAGRPPQVEITKFVPLRSPPPTPPAPAPKLGLRARLRRWFGRG